MLTDLKQISLVLHKYSDVDQWRQTINNAFTAIILFRLACIAFQYLWINLGCLDY